MGATTEIAWTHATFNPWIGCTKVHEGCTHCYAESFAKRTGGAEWGPSGTRIKTSESYWRQPLKWNREAEKAGVRKRVFCASLADIFEKWKGPILDHHGDYLYVDPSDGSRFEIGHHPDDYLPNTSPRECRSLTLNDLRADLFALIDKTPWLDWLLLTKRPENVGRMWPTTSANVMARNVRIGRHVGHHRPNVWLGCSVSSQETADRMVPKLLKCRDLCPVLFLSAEPLLGPIDLKRAVCVTSPDGVTKLGQRYEEGRAIDGVIVGNESRGAHVGRLGDFATEDEWLAGAASLVGQCQDAGVAVFVKQCPINGRVSKDPSEWPELLRVREFPQTEAMFWRGSHG